MYLFGETMAEKVEGLDHPARSPSGNALPCHILDSINASIELF